MIFWKKQIPKVYRPCFIWSIPWFVLSALGGFNKYQIVNLLICGYSIYYFIALIIQYYLLLPIFLKYTKFMLFCSGIVSAISIMLITYLSSVKGLQLPLILYAGPFTTWFIFYMLGVYISKYEKKYSIIVAMCIIIVGFILECLETYYLNTNYVGGVGIKLSSYIYSCGVILLVLSPKVQTLYKDNLFTATISYIGRISFGLYLIHCYVIQLLFVVFPTSSWRLSFCIVTFVTILIVMLSRKVLPQYLNKYLGFV